MKTAAAVWVGFRMGWQDRNKNPGGDSLQLSPTVSDVRLITSCGSINQQRNNLRPLVSDGVLSVSFFVCLWSNPYMNASVSLNLEKERKRKKTLILLCIEHNVTDIGRNERRYPRKTRAHRRNHRMNL